MSKDMVVSNQPWVKAALVLGSVMFASFALLGLLIIYRSPAMQPSRDWIFAGLSLVFGWLTCLDLRLLRFMNHELLVSHEGVVVSSRRGDQFLPWPAVELRVREMVQIFELRDRAGRLVYAVDWWALNARELLLRVAHDRQVSNRAHR